MKTSAWPDGLAEWTDGDTAYLSIAFTWKLDEAYARACWYKSAGYKVRAGGPGVFTRKHYLADVAEIGGDIPDAIARHNPLATFASRGCPVGCWFCIVPKMEGKAFTLIPDFEPRPILCDNNLSALPADYQDHIVERYQGHGVPLLDANSGFEPATFSEDVFRRWAPINRGPWRFAYDESKEGDDVRRVIRMLRKAGVSSRRIRVYVLIGNEPMAACLDRVREVIAMKGEPHCQPVMKLNALKKEPMVRFDWTRQTLTDMARWANSPPIWRKVAFEDYRRSQKTAHDPDIDQGNL